MRHRVHTILPIAALLFAGIHVSRSVNAQTTAGAGEGISVRLNAETTVTARDVQLQHVATIRCRDARIAAQIGAVDVASLKDDETSKTLSTSFVRIRLLLAGWQADRLVVDGPPTITISYREAQPLTDVDIELAALSTVQTVFGAEPDELRVRLTSPFMQVLPRNIQEQTGLRAEVLPPIRTEPGQSSMTVRLWKDRTLVATRSAKVDILRRQRVAVAKVSFRRDQVLTSSDVQFENRFLATNEDEPDDSQVIGHRPRRSVQPGEILSLKDLHEPAPEQRPIVVKARDRVQVTASCGIARVTLRAAEAMQPGRVGDVIQVKNLESNRVIPGRVTSAGHVEIQLR
ncbi:MAG: flagellar basal body P-ring formation chaperone FlgA [Planctomycetaceae bacterium]